MRIKSILPAGIPLAVLVLSGRVAMAQSAADLRTGLNRHLVEHAFLAAAVTGAALGKRGSEAKAARTALDANSRDLAHAIGAVYGDESGKAFLELWRQHIVFLVDYTRATGAGNRAMRDDAARNLAGYAEDFAAFLAAANPNLPEPVVADLIRTHVAGLTSLVDAQAAGAFDSAHVRLRGIAAHMQRIGDPLAAAIAR
ncbi:MAG TPA: hypothetical protein VFM14_15980 [Gemmatimonadales bacterium]|nr:hypothetical protein [Gemmatimonadales bacterium]